LKSIILRLFFFVSSYSRPSGSEITLPATTLSDIKSHNPDHIGGYEVAIPILSGIESKFGFKLPKFAVGSSSSSTGVAAM
jgi:solute carrier family 25 (mitochondrial aspartate/glutamate transporter), member 12/13